MFERIMKTIISVVIGVGLFISSLLGHNKINRLHIPTRTPQLNQATLTKPIGLSAVNNFEDANRVGELFDDAIYTNSNLSGVTFRTSWADIEPTKEKFQWSKLDSVFTKAEANGKWVELVIIPGFGSPQWVLKDKSIQSEEFSIQYGRGKGQTLRLPLPWDEKYLSLWSDFLKQLSNRYGNRKSFVKIAVAGPTSVSAEVSLPEEKADLKKWQALGYTPSKYINAWAQMFGTFSTTFPYQYFSLALHPGLPINEQSQIDNNEKDQTRQAVINEGLKYPRQFALQTDGLNAVKGDRTGYQIVESYHDKIITGFMMSSAFSNKTEKYGAAISALKQSLELGLKAGPVYLEVYMDDVLNPDMQSVFASTRTELLNINQSQ